MSKCKHEIFSGKCDMMSQDDFHKCVGEDICACYKPMTNSDRIRAMTDEEIAKMLAQFEYAIAVDVLATFGIDIAEMEHDFSESTKEELEWLQQPVEGDVE